MPSSCCNIRHHFNLMADSSGGFLVGVDVGTNSARAGLFSRGGNLVRHCSRQIRIWKENGCLEQSSDDIWNAVCFCVKVSRFSTSFQCVVDSFTVYTVY